MENSKLYEFNLKEIFIISKERNIIFNKYLNKSYPKKTENEIKLLLKIIKNLYPKQTNEKILKNEIAFNQLLINDEKIFFLNIMKNNFTVIAFFSNKTKNSLIKIFLLHFIISFANFIKEICELILNNKSLYSTNEMIKSKLYEKFLFLPLKEHFQKISHKILQRKNTYQSNIRYKQFYVVELESSKILFSLNSMDKKPYIEKLENHELLWKELLFHSNNLKKAYYQKFSNKVETSDYQDYFVKLEYTSTFPRLIFIIKFIPILKGISLIHIYTQNKLSRNENDKIYKEFDVIYGNDIIKESNHIEYRFNEPKIHKEIEMFFMEFYICSNISKDFFYCPKQDLKYFNFDILMIIKNSFIEAKNNNIESIYNLINNKLYEEFLLSKDNENKKKEEMTTKYLNGNKIDELNIMPIKEEKTQTINDVDSTLKKNEMMISNYQWNLLSSSQNINSFQISKNFCLQVLFSDLKNNKEINPNEVTINLTYFEDKSNNSKFDNLSEIIMKDVSYLTKSNIENSIIVEKKNTNNLHLNKGKSFCNNKNKESLNINSIKLNINGLENKSAIFDIKFKNDILNKDENENTNLLKDYVETENLNETAKSERLSKHSDIIKGN